MVPDSLSTVRHEIRTLLNHIVGYADILLEETTEIRDGELHSIFGELRELSLLLREPIIHLFTESSEKEDRESIKRRIYGLLYDIIALVQTAKRQCASAEHKVFLPDLQKILEAANGTAEIFEGVINNSLDIDHLSEGARSGLAENASPARLAGKILVVDDDAFNREIMTRHLERQGHIVSQASDGIVALEMLKKEAYDLVLLDVMMPGMNGYQFLEQIKTMPELQDLHVIVVSALDESGSVARCLRLGAEDYLPREFDPIVLRARIESCLERKRLRSRERMSLQALAETQRRLMAELRRAADYVRSLLPRRVWWQELRTDWVFLPSRDLGGDVFGYTRLANGDIALYLIDVSGHGIEAALLSVSLLNRIQTQSSADPEFWNPAGMLSNFNRFFRSEDQNNLYFTAWVGIWNPLTRVLRYCSAGSPPGVIVAADGSLKLLRTENPAIGVVEDVVYSSAEEILPPQASLYLFSDGVFETRMMDNRILGLSAFIEILKKTSGDTPSGNLARIIESVRSTCERTQFDDDVSLVGFYFNV